METRKNILFEEKGRYKWGYNGAVLLDTETKEQLGYEDVFDVLNQQDRRIKELEEELAYNKDLAKKSVRDVLALRQELENTAKKIRKN